MAEYHYKYSNGSPMPGPGGGRRDDGGDLGSWIPTLIFLFCFPPVGVILLVLKVLGILGKTQSRTYAARHPYDIQHQQAQSAPTFVRQEASVVRKKKQEKAARHPGRGLIIAGSIIAGTCGLSALINFLDALSWGGLLHCLPEIFTPLAICGGGLLMLYFGVNRAKKAKRYRQYQALIGKRDSIAVTTLAQAMGIPVGKACSDLQDMLDDGIFPTGYLDMSTGRLVLSGEGIQDPEPPKKEEAKSEAPKGMEREEAVLLEIRQVNDAIADPVMSAKIDRIGEITGKIFSYLRDKPGKEDQLRSFLSYYLPTTLKILRAYGQMEAQGIEGENITAAKKRIESMMDKVVDGFEMQLDRLFQDDAMDITSDVEVLERMLDKDGLGGQGMTLGGT